MSDFYFRNVKLTDIYPSVDSFLLDYKAVGIPATITDTNATTLYYLLYARYGNSTIASSDENQFKYKLFGLIFQYGGTWEKRLEIQTKLKALTDDELLVGTKQISNHAYNPSTEPATDSDDILGFIDSQNTLKWEKSKLDGYSNLMLLLETDVTGSFLSKFKSLFLTVVAPEKPGWYITEEEEDE